MAWFPVNLRLNRDECGIPVAWTPAEPTPAFMRRYYGVERLCEAGDETGEAPEAVDGAGAAVLRADDAADPAGEGDAVSGCPPMESGSSLTKA